MSQRKEVNLSFLLNDDPRNVVGGRQGRQEYNTVLIMRKKVFAKYHCHMSGNGVIATRQTISPLDIYMIYLHDPKYGRSKELVYHEDLIGELIVGYSGGEKGKNNLSLISSRRAVHEITQEERDEHHFGALTRYP
ncbi:MAG: hypothetical protein GY768_27470, partial [Planctomycetaceae bacterium]|nr:hypothetical protein [Planctomycetaceae bacterium]